MYDYVYAWNGLLGSVFYPERGRDTFTHFKQVCDKITWFYKAPWLCYGKAMGKEQCLSRQLF